MAITRRTLVGTIAAAAAVPVRNARAQSPAIKIGVLTDMSGPYRDTCGPGTVACVRQALEDFDPADKGFRAEILVADHQNKPDIGAAITREWFDQEGVHLLLDVPNSPMALAASAIARDRNKVFITASAATSELTGAQCGPNTIKWGFDTYMMAKSTCLSTVRAGGDTWFFITPNYLFGQQLQRDGARFVAEAGGKVLGSASYPFPETTDFASYLFQAQSSGAKVIAFANAGTDTVNSIKQAHEFRLAESGRMVAAMIGSATVVHALGLEVAQGILLTEPFYWDLNDGTRRFTRRVLPKLGGAYPNFYQAGTYAGTLHYLKAVAELGAARARADGRALVPAYLLRVKTPEQSRSAWDVETLVSTVAAEAAAVPPGEARCSLLPS